MKKNTYMTYRVSDVLYLVLRLPRHNILCFNQFQMYYKLYFFSFEMEGDATEPTNEDMRAVHQIELDNQIQLALHLVKGKIFFTVNNHPAN